MARVVSAAFVSMFSATHPHPSFYQTKVNFVVLEDSALSPIISGCLIARKMLVRRRFGNEESWNPLILVNQLVDY